MEFMNKGDLSQYAKENQENARLLKICLDVTEVLNFFATRPAVYLYKVIYFRLH